MSSSSTSCVRSPGKRDMRSSSSSRTVWPRAGTCRSPPTSCRNVGGMRTVVMRVSASPWLSWPGAGGASSRAELGVVDVFGDGRVLAADGACGVLLQPDLAELGRERVEEQQPADQRLADPEQQLD